MCACWFYLFSSYYCWTVISMMVLYAKIFYFYRTALARAIRMLVFLILLTIIFSQIPHNTVPRFMVFFLNVCVMIEIFFHYKICKAVPKKTVDKNKGKELLEMYESFTMPALYGFTTYSTTSHVMRHIMEYPQVKLIMQKADMTHADVPLHDVDKDLLAKSSFQVSQVFKGKFVTTMDVFTAYIFLIEKEDRLLFAKQLKTDDLYNMLYWTRLEHPEEETPKKIRVRFDGGGIGEVLNSGWTPETKKYTAN